MMTEAEMERCISTPRNTEVAGTYQEPGERPGTHFPTEAPERTHPADTLISDFSLQHCERIRSYSIPSHAAPLPCHQAPWAPEPKASRVEPRSGGRVGSITGRAVLGQGSATLGHQLQRLQRKEHWAGGQEWVLRLPLSRACCVLSPGLDCPSVT